MPIHDDKMTKIRWKWKTLFVLFLSFFSIFSLTILFINYALPQRNSFPQSSSDAVDPPNSSHFYVDFTNISEKKANQSKQKVNSSILLGNGLWFDKQNEEANEENNNEIRKIDPTFFKEFLPHLRRNSFRNLTSLNAKVLLKADNLLRSPPEFVLLIPSTNRVESNYLVDTLQNLVQNIAEEEKHLVQIVVMLSENPWDQKMGEKINKSANGILAKFARQINEGLIEVISPPIEWFPPNLEHISPTLGDPLERMRWRTKQCLDYAFAMFHVHLERPKARFYVQLEDDILTVPNFISEMRRFANSHPGFFLNELSNLGFIGRMFHNNDDLSHMAHFILLLHKAIPVDWVLSNVLSAKYCSLDENWKKCLKTRIENVVVFKRNPPIFQHVGRHSSLTGKVQKLMEKDFGKNGKIEMLQSGNPAAVQFHGTIPLGDTKMRALYERYAPLEVDLAHQRAKEDGTEIWLAIEYSGQKLAQIRGLRIFFSLQFPSPLPIPLPPLPNSSPLLTVRISHSAGNSTFPQNGVDHFLLLFNQSPLQNVSSIQIGLNAAAGNNWQMKAKTLRLMAIQIMP